ncbi:MAG: NUDIX hydrolase [Tildeniella torsiva UHER 1998/13D]|jgi:8-oxo-dGTP pyrophosphatase MutT (NUDIX family)|nr:NUDIX hydrolase [Tildeniella torsiva UHER 1998/13D]
MIEPQNCAQAIASHTPIDPAEAESIVATLAFLDEHDRCWQRDNYVGHLTASAWVVNAAKSHVLLTHHRKFNYWLQLGGHVDEEDGSLLAAALREAREESGIQAIEPLQTTIFDIGHHPINTAKEPPHVHYDIRFLLVAKTMDFVMSEESNDLAWVPLGEVATVSSSAALRRMAQKLC